MPTYVYKCTNDTCAHTQEVQHSVHAAGPDSCSCGSPLRRVFSTPAITFKGSGFYHTDSRN